MSRLTQVLRAGEAHARATRLNDLPEDITKDILLRTEGPLQTCELVGNMCASGGLVCNTREALLDLVRIIFFEALQAGSTNAGIATVLENLFGAGSAQTADGVKALLARLCNGYTIASRAILKMEGPMPWVNMATFDWGSWDNQIPFTATRGGGWGTPQTQIQVFTNLAKAAELAAYYHELVADEPLEKERMLRKAQVRVQKYRFNPEDIKVLHSTDRSRGPGPHPIETFTTETYDWKWGRWFGTINAVRTLVANGGLPKEFQNPAWKPLNDHRLQIRKLKTYIREGDAQILVQQFVLNDALAGSSAPILVNAQQPSPEND